MNPWNPDWVVRPGETLTEMIEERGLTVLTASRVCGLSVNEVQGVLDGQPITERIAYGLARLGISAQFWINLEDQYRDGVAAGKKELS